MKARFFVSTLTGIILASAAGAAAASEYCTRAPREQWKPQEQARAAAESIGYKVVSVQAENGCYEVKADKGGKRYDMKFHPTDMRMISRYVDRGGSELALR